MTSTKLLNSRDTYKHENKEKLSINRFTLFTCKLGILKKLVKNHNLNRKVLSIVLIQTPTNVYIYNLVFLQKVLKEIVLVDDFSNINEFPHLGKLLDYLYILNILLKIYLGSELEDWIKKTNKVRISRNKKREGLIVSKNLGVLQASGEVVVFLDAHCEAGIPYSSNIIFSGYFTLLFFKGNNSK